MAQVFASPKLVGTSIPYSTQAEVDGAAKAMADHVAGGFAEVDGLARGNPKLKAGTPISISLSGEPFDGKYTLTSTRHNYNPHDGYTTALHGERTQPALTARSGIRRFQRWWCFRRRLRPSPAWCRPW